MTSCPCQALTPVEYQGVKAVSFGFAGQGSAIMRGAMVSGDTRRRLAVCFSVAECAADDMLVEGVAVLIRVPLGVQQECSSCGVHTTCPGAVEHGQRRSPGA